MLGMTVLKSLGHATGGGDLSYAALHARCFGPKGLQHDAHPATVAAGVGAPRHKRKVTTVA